MTSALALVPPFRTVFETYAPFVWRVLKRLGVRESEIADVSQETFLVLHKRLATFEGRSSLKTFVYGVAVRVAADHRKRAWVRKERPTEELPEQGGSLQTGERALSAKQSLLTLDKALGELDEHKRTVFVLYELEDLSLVEIAEITGSAISTLHARLSLARDHVRHRLAPPTRNGSSTKAPAFSSDAPDSPASPRRLA